MFPKYLIGYQNVKIEKWNLNVTLHKQWSFLLKISSVIWPNSLETADLVTFTEKILSGKFRFFVQCEKSKKSKYKINVVLKENEKKQEKKTLK